MPQRFGRPGLLGTIARTAVISGTATAVSNRVERRGMQRQTAAQAPQMPAAPPPPPPAAAPAGTDRVGQLTQLADLKAQGLLTDEEFAAEKARILGS
ncbi:SHOCT domain-containing protein [Streptomyces durocortorensis]|uniref:SHOCT domain-containing protein n=1 Tax=Streptomyces durocortorensis TaxID=2811104 RepID=A0ABS2I168_9ACTN|nr:SHOCT domain-containing protein [Streptomyces durocortorensis]MBM7056981.1 SHOCT domain-containing protein [Streptomyces durocortorensis]